MHAQSVGPQQRPVSILHLLLMAAVCEFSLYRLIAPALKPPTDIPLWHALLEGLGLFLSYFAALLAAVLIVRMLWRMVVLERPYHAGFRWALCGAAGLSATLAAYSMFADANAFTSTWLRICLAITVVVLLLALMVGIKFLDYSPRAVWGVCMMTIPLLLTLAPFMMLVVGPPETRYSDFEPRMNEAAFAYLVMAGIAMPLCFAPRPILRSLTQTGPLTISLVISLMGALILRQHYEVGWRLAERGIALDMGPGLPANWIALAVVALGAVAWTLASCYMAPTEARGEIGIGISLIIMGGLIVGGGFPARYLLTLAGLLVLADASTRVREQEEHLREPRAGLLQGPPIAADAWQAYIRTLLAKLRGAPGADDGDEANGSAVTVGGEEEIRTTHVVTVRRGVQMRLCVELRSGSIMSIDLLCGDVPRVVTKLGEPAWTLYARPERMLGLKAHPEPPTSGESTHKTGDDPFDRRFIVRGAAATTDQLLDDELRSRTTALIDGWIAYWPGRGLLYRVYPGRGAPLDHPIPITELAFRGEDAEPSVDRMLTVIDLLAEISARVVPPEDERSDAVADDTADEESAQQTEQDPETAGSD